MKAIHLSFKAFFWLILFQLSYGNTLSASADPDPAPDLTEAWESLQSLAGHWMSKGEQLVKWEQQDSWNLRKVLQTGDEQRVLGQLIREEDQIIYEVYAKGERFTMQLIKADPTSWTFEAQADQLLQLIKLSLDETGVLRSEMIAVSPNGRRLTTSSELNRIAENAR